MLLTYDHVLMVFPDAYVTSWHNPKVQIFITQYYVLQTLSDGLWPHRRIK